MDSRIRVNIDADFLYKELKFKTSRSGGAGGQHVNKVNSKVSIQFDVYNSKILSDEEKQLIIKRLNNRITNSGLLILSADNERSQLLNKSIVLQRLNSLLKMAFQVEKHRTPTKPTMASRKRRSEFKKRLSAKKQLRKKL